MDVRIVNSSMPRVLLVDDATDEREMYAEFFQLRGYFTLQATNAKDAYRIALELSPAAIVTDVWLPGTEDGLSLTRRLKQDARTSGAAVIVLTGNVFHTDRTAARAAGCDRFLPKPCLPSTLADVVSELIATRVV